MGGQWASLHFVAGKARKGQKSIDWIFLKSKKSTEIDWLNIFWKARNWQKLIDWIFLTTLNVYSKWKPSTGSMLNITRKIWISLFSFISINHGQVWLKYKLFEFRITKSLMMAKYGGVDTCPACQKSVYPLEKVFICICICGQKKCI